MLVRTPAVSPDGTRALFQVDRAGTWLLEFKSGAMKKVLADPSAEEYAWAPDGRRVAYHSRSEGKWGIWIMSETSNPSKADEPRTGTTDPGSRITDPGPRIRIPAK
jgi:Tol biopolymer transport system component